MARALAPKVWFPKSQPQTLQIAVCLLYWNAFLTVVSGLVGLHFGPFSLLGLVGDVAGAFGVANERRWGYVVAVAAAIFPLLLILFSAIYGGGYVGGGLLTLAFDIALVALLLHPVSRGYFRTWFR